MEESNPANKFLCTKPGGNGDRRSRPKLRWCEELQDVAGAGCRNWRMNVQAREEWQKLTKEAKGHPAM
jgi:hypothetical protein